MSSYSAKPLASLEMIRSGKEEVEKSKLPALRERDWDVAVERRATAALD
jgi:hypothetical protein